MKKYVAFFDLDHTIFDVNSGRVLIEHAHKRGLINIRQIFLAYIFSGLYGIRLLNAQYIMKQLAVWLKGIPENEFADFTTEIFNNHLKTTVRHEAQREIEEHKKNDAQLVILSAATSYICKPAKDLFLFDDLLCSKMEVKDGAFSGKPLGNYCYGEEKLKRVIDYCTQHNFNIQQSYYYADSFSDIRVLETVGHPVCVTPDRRLKRAAKKNDWPICNW